MSLVLGIKEDTMVNVLCISAGSGGGGACRGWGGVRAAAAERWGACANAALCLWRGRVAESASAISSDAQRVGKQGPCTSWGRVPLL